jgi:DNA-binding Lrp family transcriptional regulator
MDQLDFKIFRTLGLRPYGREAGDFGRLNPWVIAKKLGVDGNTVKIRLAKMKKNGFIRYFQIYPNYRLLGINGGAYLFEIDGPERKNDIINQCALVEGVTEIASFVGNEICIDFTYRDAKDESRRLKLLSGLANAKKSEKFYERVMPSVRIELSNTDWRIIKALRYNAFKPLSKVAQELGLSTKTVRRRFERMIDNNAVIIVPVIHPGDVPNTITHVLLLYFKESQRQQALIEALRLFEDNYFLVDTMPEGNAMLGLVAQTLAETEDNFIKAKKIDGIRNVKMLILKETREFSEWLDLEIDRKIVETSIKRPHPGVDIVSR